MCQSSKGNSRNLITTNLVDGVYMLNILLLFEYLVGEKLKLLIILCAYYMQFGGWYTSNIIDSSVKKKTSVKNVI